MVERPGGLSLELVSSPPRETALRSPDFWTAVRALDLDSARRWADTEDRRRFVQALQRVSDGSLEKAAIELEPLLTADEVRLREQSKEALEKLLEGGSQWARLADLNPESLLAESYREAPTEVYEIPEKPVSLPARIGWLRIPRIPVRLEGRDYEFAVDTGAAWTVITDEVARECGIEGSTRSQEGETSTNIRIDFWAGLAEELHLGEIRIRNHPVAIVRSETLDFGVARMEGVIGWPVFQHLRAEIDYRRDRMVLSRPKPGPEHVPRNLFWLGYPLVQLRSESGVPLHFGLDTGARTSSFHPNVLDKIDLGVLGRRQSVSIGAGGRETTVKREASDVTLFLEEHRLHFDEISIQDGVKHLAVLEPDGKLGGDVAYGGKIVIDFVNGRFELERP